MKKDRKVHISYTVTLKPHEFAALVELAQEWGFNYDKPTRLKLVKRALENSGVSGCLSGIPSEPPTKHFTVKKLPRLEYSGGWHDKPLKWVAECLQYPEFTQKFSTKKHAIGWKRIASKASSFNDAFSDYQFID